MSAAHLPSMNVEAEARVLGALLRAGAEGVGERTLARVRETGLTAESFYFRERHGYVFEAIVTLVDRGSTAEPLVVIRELENAGRIELVGGATRIHRLPVEAVAISNADHHARLVVEAAARRAQDAPTTGSDVLDEVAEAVRRYVVVGGHELVTLALWVAHTHAFDAAEATPYMAVSSPEKESGKTRLLEDVLRRLVARPWYTARVSPAALTRKIDAHRPTLLLDESDSALRSGDEAYSEALRNVLNSGYRRGGAATVCVGQGAKIEARDFDTFCPKAFAGIGDDSLPDTVRSRSVPIRLVRRTAEEAVERAYGRHLDALLPPVHERVAAWASPLVDVLAEARPDPLPELADRAFDVWEPLLTIADLAGGEWPQRARSAAVALCARSVGEDESIGVRLLSDVRDVFERKGSDRVATADLLAELAADEEAPWHDWKAGKPLTARSLAGLLRRHRISSRTIRLGEETAKGYLAELFAEAWERYLPPGRASIRHRVTTRMGTGIEADSEAPQEAPVADREQAANPHGHSDVTDVTDRNPDTRAQEAECLVCERPFDPGDEGAAPFTCPDCAARRLA